MGFLASPLGADVAKARGETVLAEPARAAAQWVRAQGQPVRSYRFAQVPARWRQPGPGPGAAHATDLPYVCGTLAAPHGADRIDESDRLCSEVMQAAWVASAREGDPGAMDHPGLTR